MIYQKIVVVFYYMIELLRLFQKRSFVLSSEHENQNVATIGTLLDQLLDLSKDSSCFLLHD